MADRHGNYGLVLRWMFRKLTYMSDKMKKNKMKVVCNTHMKDNIFIQNLSGKREGTRPLGTSSHTWGIITKRFLKYKL